MMHNGARTTGGNMPAELQQKVAKLLDEFGALVQGISQEHKIHERGAEKTFRFLLRRLASNFIRLAYIDVIKEDEENGR